MRYIHSYGVVKKDRSILLVVLLAVGFTFSMIAGKFTIVDAAKPGDKPANSDCVTIQDGVLTYFNSDELLQIGSDQWGYNYQGHLFNGYFDNNTRPDPVVEEGSRLQMKWNDAWLANRDCDDDGLLDRHAGYDSYIGSGAWLTNHERWTDDDGKHAYFIKIVAAPADAYKDGGYWYTVDDEEIGEVIWGQFAIIQEVESGVGASYHSPIGPGLGNL